MDKLTGYLNHNYAHSLQEFGQPRELPRCKGWLLERKIPGSEGHDAMGCYPLFVCKDWSQLSHDLENIGNDLVSVSLVTDPFGQYDEAYLRECFRDVVTPFKKHFIVDLQQPGDAIVCRHHRRYARKALRHLRVEACQEPAQLIDEWATLYDNLIKRHALNGIKAFSRRAFALQLRIPGTVMLSAMHNGIPIAQQVWFVQGEVGYNHLSAISEAGYTLKASFALYWFAIEYFSGRARWLDLGGGAGARNDSMDGLSLFKCGWSTETRIAYFCGRIFDRKRYSAIVKAKGVDSTDYFPAYRKGEFT